MVAPCQIMAFSILEQLNPISVIGTKKFQAHAHPISSSFFTIFEPHSLSS
jgi:hypothetical protein